MHFGLYKNNHAINPANTINVVKNTLKGREKRKFLTYVKKYNKEIQVAINDKIKPKKEETFAFYMNVKRDKKVSNN